MGAGMSLGVAPCPIDGWLAPMWASAWGEDDVGLYAEFEVAGVVQRMRWIAAGRFIMGSPEGEKGRVDDEVLHEVELTKGYWLADTACTQELWEAVTGENPSRFKEGGKRRPVERVSWDDCQGFIVKLNQRVEGLEIRLPTEAEWENACRAGMRTAYSFGEKITPKEVNLGSETVEVKSLPANQWGLYEMHGNVFEWCMDWYGPYGTKHGVDPRGLDTGQYRVLRGGSWGIAARGARSASRGSGGPGYRHRFFGFRLARGQ
jgi:formylglycine-generating enzyme